MGMSRQRRKSASDGADDREQCAIDGAKLRRFRLDAELSIRALAYAVGVDPKTITDIEAGRRDRSFVRVARSIASHPDLDIEWTELLAVNGPKAPVTISTTTLPARSSLDAIVDEERRIGKLPPTKTDSGLIPSFGAAELVHVFASPGSREGQRFCVRGEVYSQRGLPPDDAAVLGVSYESGARFEIIRQIGAVEKPLVLTIVTTTAAHTRHLQAAWEERRSAAVTILVVAAAVRPDEDRHVYVTDLADGKPVRRNRPKAGDQLWQGFKQISGKSERAPKPHPWALVVTAIN